MKSIFYDFNYNLDRFQNSGKEVFCKETRNLDVIDSFDVPSGIRTWAYLDHHYPEGLYSTEVLRIKTAEGYNYIVLDEEGKLYRYIRHNERDSKIKVWDKDSDLIYIETPDLTDWRTQSGGFCRVLTNKSSNGDITRKVFHNNGDVEIQYRNGKTKWTSIYDMNQ